jgi:hypothetical protein
MLAVLLLFVISYRFFTTSGGLAGEVLAFILKFENHSVKRSVVSIRLFEARRRNSNNGNSSNNGIRVSENAGRHQSQFLKYFGAGTLTGARQDILSYRCLCAFVCCACPLIYGTRW